MDKYYTNKRGSGLYRIANGYSFERFNPLTGNWEKDFNEEIFYYGERIEISEEEANKTIEELKTRNAN